MNNKTMKKRTKPTNLTKKGVVHILQMIHVVPRHYAEIQDELHLDRTELDNVLDRLEKKGLINILKINLCELPFDREEILKRAYPRREQNGFSFLNPLLVSQNDYPDGIVAFYYLTLKGFRYLKSRGFKA